MQQLEDKLVRVKELEIQKAGEIRKDALQLMDRFLQITENDSKNLTQKMDCMNRRLGVLLQMVYWLSCPGSNMIRHQKIQKILQNECEIQEVENDL